MIVRYASAQRRVRQRMIVMMFGGRRALMAKMRVIVMRASKPKQMNVRLCRVMFMLKVVGMRVRDRS